MSTPLSTQRPAILLLADGTVFKGIAAGKIGTAIGEICFNTGMTGYQEIFTDPSYTGQIMVTATAHIGNYGVHTAEVESNSLKIAGLVCKNFSPDYSRPQGKSTLGAYLTNDNLVAIANIDTRALVSHIRSKGAMNAIISSDSEDIAYLQAELAKAPNMEGLELSSKVSTTQAYTVGDEAAPRRVAVMDYGVKQNMIRLLNQRGCYVKVFPYNTSFDEVRAFAPNGVLLSNGPGDPATLTQPIAEIKKMLEAQLPIFGICLGHQLLAQAAGIGTFKMHNGHRGINHPVKNLLTNRAEVTSQNHGFSVVAADIAKAANVEVTHINLNDDTIEGIRLTNAPAFSVQYHPEANPGPHDSAYLFDDFVGLMAI